MLRCLQLIGPKDSGVVVDRVDSQVEPVLDGLSWYVLSSIWVGQWNEERDGDNGDLVIGHHVLEPRPCDGFGDWDVDEARKLAPRAHGDHVEVLDVVDLVIGDPGTVKEADRVGQRRRRWVSVNIGTHRGTAERAVSGVGIHRGQ